MTDFWLDEKEIINTFNAVKNLYNEDNDRIKKKKNSYCED